MCYNLPVTGMYWGYNPLILIFYYRTSKYVLNEGPFFICWNQISFFGGSGIITTMYLLGAILEPFFQPEPGGEWSSFTCAYLIPIGWFNHQLAMYDSDFGDVSSDFSVVVGMTNTCRHGYYCISRWRKDRDFIASFIGCVFVGWLFRDSTMGCITIFHYHFGEYVLELFSNDLQLPAGRSFIYGL